METAAMRDLFGRETKQGVEAGRPSGRAGFNPSIRVENKLRELPSEVGKRLIGVGHAVDVFAFGDRGPFAFERGQQFLG